jgi:hypothetical protein
LLEKRQAGENAQNPPQVFPPEVYHQPNLVVDGEGKMAIIEITYMTEEEVFEHAWKHTPFPFNLWFWREAGLIHENEVHRILGRHFGYPECCIEFFIEQWGNSDLAKKWGYDCPVLGSYIRCPECWNGGM